MVCKSFLSSFVNKSNLCDAIYFIISVSISELKEIGKADFFHSIEIVVVDC